MIRLQLHGIYEVTDKLAIDNRTRVWCKLPYPNHPNGCRMFGTRPECPPQAPLVSDWIDISKPHWFIIIEFDLDEHKIKMKRKHPNWSDKQCGNLYYWQNSVRARLKEHCEMFVLNHPGTIFTLIPEAMGVNVFKTIRKLDVKIPIKPKPKEKVFKIALIGHTNGLIQKTLFDCR